MKKNVIVLVNDYWHKTKSIEPLIPLLFDACAWNVTFTENPFILQECKEVPDLFVSFKDPIENDQIPTPIWCDGDWSETLKQFIESGMGFLAVHCGLTDLPKEHMLSKEVFRSVFIGHPPQCAVQFIPCKEHPITSDVAPFTFPQFDEHYVIEIDDHADTEILAYTESEHGRQPALWAHTVGKGNVCCITPGHDTPNLICPEYLKVLKNAAAWCASNP